MAADQNMSIYKDLYEPTVQATKKLILPSTCCVIIHLYKFFRSTAPLLATKNLTFYCFFLFLYYLTLLWEFISFYPSTSIYIDCYLSLTITLLKLLIALDVCLCFRNIAVYLQHPPGSQNKKFFIYCSLGSIAPFAFILLCVLFWDNRQMNIESFKAIYLYEVITIIRFSRLIPILLAFWYIRLASIDKSELWLKFSLHIRLLIMLGGFAAIFSGGQLYAMIVSDEQYYSRYNETTNSIQWTIIRSTTIDPMTESFFARVQELGTALEGLVIGLVFTFKKDTFRSTTATNNSHTKTSTTNNSRTQTSG